MIHGLWGIKKGMTQVFVGDEVVPVTVIDVSNWFITGLRNKDTDGYNAVQVGLIRNRYIGKVFNKTWLSQKKRFFSTVKEIKTNEEIPFLPGQEANFIASLAIGSTVDVAGKSKGCGFAGVYKRHGFGGAPKSHGSRMGRRPGSLGFMHACGKTIKGKKLGGHLGAEQMVMKRLKVVRVLADEKMILVKGSVPGKAGAVLYIRRNAL